MPTGISSDTLYEKNRQFLHRLIIGGGKFEPGFNSTCEAKIPLHKYQQHQLRSQLCN